MLIARKNFPTRHPARGRTAPSTVAVRPSDRTRSSCEVSAIWMIRKPYEPSGRASLTQHAPDGQAVNARHYAIPRRSAQRVIKRRHPLTIPFDRKLLRLQFAAVAEFGAQIGVVRDLPDPPRDIVGIIR